MQFFNEIEKLMKLEIGATDLIFRQLLKFKISINFSISIKKQAGAKMLNFQVGKK